MSRYSNFAQILFDGRKQYLVLVCALLSMVAMMSMIPYKRVVSPFLVEDCANGVDDDGDGLIDLNDPDCICKVAEPISLIPNPSFEENNCCPRSWSQLYCANTWIQASEATTDYLHTCGWMGWNGMPPPMPFPDGEACIGYRDGRFGNSKNANWKEYTGTCLLAPLKARVKYRFEFYVGFTHYNNSPPTNVTFFGTTNCDYLPFGVGNQYFGCPTNDKNWIELGNVPAAGTNTWLKKTITITPPQDIYAIAIGPSCYQLPRDSIDTYYFFDNLILADERDFDYKITTINHPCNDNFQLVVPKEDYLTYQWYKEGIAIVGATTHSYQPKKEDGIYQAMIQDGASCWLTTAYAYRVPVETAILSPIICPDEAFSFHGKIWTQEGIYTETIRSVNNCDSIVTIYLSIADNEVSQVDAKIFEGEIYKVGQFNFYDEGKYEARLKTQYGCDSLVQLSLSYYHVFIPNAFSPNNDGVNDDFTILSNSDLKQISSLKIFNRWGEIVHSIDHATSLAQVKWNGMSRGVPSPQGIYLYVATIVMDDDIERTIQGSFLLSL
jgi:gliding motility-associated-like protein